jgi:hypothetical protein
MKVLFVGPTLFGVPFDDTGIAVRGPAQQGDILAAVEAGATVIGLVDGVFGSVPSAWHKEILYALSQGVRVLGAASLGALRAAECAPFGMEPVGGIAREYLEGRRDADADVCLAHCPAELDYRPLSEPLVDVEATLTTLSQSGAISDAEATALLFAAANLFFADRTVDEMLRTAHLHPDRVAAVAAAYRAGRVSRKAADALLLVSRLHAAPDQRSAPPTEWTLVASDPWRHYLAQR